MAQIQTQLRGMSPDACFIHVRELQEMAHSELLLSQSDDHLNGMSPLPLAGHQHHTSATTGYRNASVSSISSPMRQQQHIVGSSTAQLALFSPMASDPTTSPSQSRAPPYHHAETETELEVSSSPSKMMLTTADDDGLEDNSSHTNEDLMTSSVGLKLHRNKDFSSVRQPNIQKKKDTLSPTTTPLPPKKKISSAKKKISSAKKKSATKSSPVKGGSSKAKKGFTLPKTVAKGKKTRAKKKNPTTQTQTGVENPTNADVLCGRGFVANNHKGNMQFRDYVMQLRCVYQESQKGDKKALAEEVVSLVKTDGGRFLRMGEDELWYEVADEAARKKASQAFREDKW